MMHHGVMAGGMNKRGAWGAMSERVQRPPDPAPEPDPPEPAPSVKHCWVSDQHGRLPGLLLEWRRTEAGFQGRVVRPVFDDGWILVDEWLPAAILGPA